MANFTWIGGSGNNYLTPGNWSPSGPPGQNDNATIDLSSITVTETAVGAFILGNSGVGSLLLANDVNLDGVAGTSIIVGDLSGSNGSLKILSGATLVDQSGTAGDFVGDNAGATGVVTVSGAGSTWSDGGRLFVGLNGTGSLTISNSGTVTTTGNGSTSDLGVYIGTDAGGSGTIIVTGPGSQFSSTGRIGAGSSGTGLLEVLNGSTVTTSAPSNSSYSGIFAAGNIGASGTIIVSGAGSLLNAGQNQIGVAVPPAGTNIQTTGTLIVSDGATVLGATANSANEAGLLVGYAGDVSSITTAESTGVVSIDGAGTTVTVYGNANFGRSGAAVLTMSNDAVANLGSDPGTSDTGVYFGTSSGSTAQAVIESGATLNAFGGVYIGLQGTAAVSVQGGGQISSTLLGADSPSTGLGIVIGNTTGTGTLVVSDAGSLLSTNSQVSVGRSGTGSLTIENGASLSAGSSLNLSSNSALIIGSKAGSTGSFLLTGIGSTATLNGQADFGDSGSGSGTISGGGTLTSGDPTGATSSGIAIANAAGGSGRLLIDGTGTAVSNTGRFSVGKNGIGNLTISGGAVVTSTGNGSTGAVGMSFGANSAAAGSGTVTGAGTLLKLSNSLAVGGGSTTVAGGGTEVTQGGAGSLAVLNAAVVTVAGGAYVTATGSVSIGGGVLETDTASVSAGGAISGFGTLSGAITDDGSITASGGGLTVNGAVSGTGVLALAAASALTLAASETAPVLFTGANELLSLESGASMGGAVSGVVAGDTFDLQGMPNATAVYSGGGSAASTITVGSAVITLLGAASLLSFTPQSDGAGGTELVASGNAGPDGNLDYLGTGSSNLTSQGADTIVGGSGAATVTASGTPLFFGGAGATLFDLTGASGTLVGGGSETVNAGGANVLQFGGAGSVDFIGGSGASTVIGGAAGNTITGGSGNLLYFGNGATTYIPATGIDTVVGFDGSLTGTGGMNGTLFFSGLAGNNDISTGPGSSTIIGFGAADSLVAAGGGNNIIAESGTASSIFGAQGTGQNTFFAFGTNDVVQGGAGQTAIESAVGNQTLIAGSGSTLFEILDSGANRAITITDFNANQDFVELEGYGASAATIALSGAAMAGGNELLTLADGTQVTFLGVTNLSAGSFIPTS